MTYMYWRGRVHEAHQVTYPARRYYGSFIGKYTFFEITDKNYKPLSEVEGEWIEWHDPETWPTSLKITTFSDSNGYSEQEW